MAAWSGTQRLPITVVEYMKLQTGVMYFLEPLMAARGPDEYIY